MIGLLKVQDQAINVFKVNLIFKILLGVSLLVGIILTTIIFLPADVAVSRSTIIKAHPHKIYEYIIDYRNYTEWNPWACTDSNANWVLGDTIKGEGAKYMWNSEENGVGSIRITNTVQDNSINEELIFKSPMDLEAKVYWEIKDLSDGRSQVTWKYYQEDLGYPIEKVMALFLDDHMRPDYEQGIENVKKIMEK